MNIRAQVIAISLFLTAAVALFAVVRFAHVLPDLNKSLNAGGTLLETTPEKAQDSSVLIKPTPAGNPGAESISGLSLQDAADTINRRSNAEVASPFKEPAPDSQKNSNVGTALHTGSSKERLLAADAIIQNQTLEGVKNLLEETKRCQDPSVRQGFLAAVKRIDADQYAIPLVEVIAELSNGDLRTAVQDALVSKSSPEGVRALRESAETNAESEKAVREIGRTLSQFKGEVAISELLSGIDSPIPAVQAGCIAALAQIGTSEVAEGLYSAFEGSEALQRDMIVEGFRRLRNPIALPALTRIASQNEDNELSVVIDETIANITAQRIENSGDL